MINFQRTFTWPFRSIRARHGHPPPRARDDRNASGLGRVPVVVVDVGAVEALDHLGGTGAGFDGLEDAEGDQGAATFVVQAVRVDDEGDVGEGLGEVEGVEADLPDVVPSADVEGGGGRLPRGAGVDVREFEGDVADAGAPVGDAELAGARGDVLAILTANVHDARPNLRLRRPTCALLRRDCLACLLIHRHRLTLAQRRHLCLVHVLVFSFICLWVAEQNTAGRAESARTCPIGMASVMRENKPLPKLSDGR